MTSKNSKAVDAILEIIKFRVDKSINESSFDKTYRGIVKEVLDNYKYKVQIQGTVYTIPCSTEQTFKINDVVYILFPQNNKNDAHITGKVR